MRKEKKQAVDVSLSAIQGYHARTDYRANYATQGFETQFQCFASDRPTAADGTKKTVGIEIEMTSGINNEQALATVVNCGIKDYFPKGLMKQQHDGSLGRATATEIITQPMTKAFIRNQYNAFKAFWTFLKRHDISPDNSCGMHCNISMVSFGKTRDEQIKAITRLHNFMCTHYKMCCALFKRDLNHTDYCGRMRINNIDMCGSHYYMMNYSHMNDGNGAARVEIRLVGPQRTFPNFRNTMETVFHLVEAAKDGRDFSNIVAVFKGCNECVLERLSDLIPLGYLSVAEYDAIKATSKNSGIKDATSDNR